MKETVKAYREFWFAGVCALMAVIYCASQWDDTVCFFGKLWPVIKAHIRHLPELLCGWL